MTWATATLIGPPTTNYVTSVAMYGQVAAALLAHPSGAWSLEWSRDVTPYVRIWKCAAAYSGMTADFYVSFAWRDAAPSELNVTIAETWNSGTTTLWPVPFLNYSTTYSVTAGTPYGQFTSASNSYNVTGTPSGYGYSLNGGTNSSAWMGIGVARDGVCIAISDTINDTAPDRVYVGAFDSLVAGPNLVDFPIWMRVSAGAGNTCRYPIYNTSYTESLQYVTVNPFIKSSSMAGTLGNPSTEWNLTGPIAYREYLLHNPALPARGQVRGLAKYMLNIAQTGSFYLNDRVTIGEKEFAWTGGWWWDTTV